MNTQKLQNIRETAKILTGSRQDIRNTAHFFVEARQIAWALFVVTLLWGVYSYLAMPKRKDPEIQIRRAVAICAWPGAGAERIERLVTPRIEEQLARNARVEKIESVSRNSVAIVHVALDEKVKDIGKEFDDIRLKLDSIRDLPPAVPQHRVIAAREALARYLKDSGDRDDARPFSGPGFIGIDLARRLSAGEKVKEVFRSIPEADRIRDDWGAESFVADLRIDSDRANLANISNLDVAASSAAGVNGMPITALREGDQQIPVVARLRAEERAQLSDLQNLYVYSLEGASKVPLRQVAKVDYRMETAKLARRNQFRTITVSCAPVPGVLPSQIFKAARKRLDEFAKTLPAGYRLEIGGEQEERLKGFKDLGVVMVVSAPRCSAWSRSPLTAGRCGRGCVTRRLEGCCWRIT